MSAAEVLAEMPESFIPKVCRVFSNPTRYKILLLLDKEPRTFTALMKMLTVNPKVLNDHLNTLIANKLAAKSYAYNVYTLTPLGRLVKEALAEMNNKLKEPLKTLTQWEGLG
ncbi:MAG: helix-turn-helix domain-containing protein [Nitrososphaerales archaeon]